METNNKSSVISLLLLLLLVVVGVFWLKPNWDEVSALNTTLEARQNEKATLDSDLQNLQAAQQTLNQGTEVSQQMVLDAIPEKFQQDQLIIQITDIAKKYSINMSSISFSIPLNSTDPIKKATINVSMTGSEGDLLLFLKGLENNLRKLVVKNITVQFGSSGDPNQVNFNISMETYFQGGL